jgi:hypothetical protein
MSTIPARTLVSVIPSVLGAGGAGIDVVGLFLTNSTRAPIGEVLSFPTGQAVQDYFGPGSVEDIAANGATNRGTGYFGGFTNSNKKPASILFAQYNQNAVGAYLRGGDVSSLTLAQLQAISGTLAVTINGVAKTGSPNLSAATSPSAAATIIADALDIEGGAGASFTASIAGTTMTVSAVASGTLAVGQLVNGAGTTAGTFITAPGTGTGGTGTYTVNASQTVGSGPLTTTQPGVTYDSVSGAFVINSNTTGGSSTIGFATGTISDDLKLTAATGAVVSQGAIAAVPATFMDQLIVRNSNFVCFTTLFDPDSPGENTVKQALAAWKNSQNNRFAYIAFDTDVTPTESVPATASLGYILAQNEDSGTVLLDGDANAGWDVNAGISLAAFVMGAAASIDFAQRNGRITFAFKAQEGMMATVTDPTIASNLGGLPQVPFSYGNGYNFYGAYGTANPEFTWFQRGLVTGNFRWFDSYINQVWLNNAFQIALLNLMNNARSIPYTVAGATLIEAALADAIRAGLDFGAFAPGPLTETQKAVVNSSAGIDIAQTLQSQGYYLQVKQASPSVRNARTSPPCTFWYIDGGSVQSINLSSVALT